MTLEREKNILKCLKTVYNSGRRVETKLIRLLI